MGCGDYAMKSKYILVIIVIACGFCYIYYANSNNIDLLDGMNNIIDPYTKIHIISNVKWSMNAIANVKIKDFDGSSYWISDFKWKSGEGNYTLEVKDTNVFELSGIRVDMSYAFYEEMPNNAFLELTIIKRGKIIFNKTVNDRTCITWES